MPFGGVLALVFFVLVYFAALTSGLSLAEVMFRWAENRFGWSRKRAIYVMLGATFLVGLSTVFSFNIWADVKIAGRSLFDMKDYLVTAYIMPLGGLGVILFAAWVMPVEALKKPSAMTGPYSPLGYLPVAICHRSAFCGFSGPDFKRVRKNFLIFKILRKRIFLPISNEGGNHAVFKPCFGA